MAYFSNAIEELHKDEKHCREEILRVRDAISSTKADEKTFEAGRKSLGFMLIYCPDSLKSVVESQLTELERRLIYAEMKWARET